MPSGPRPGAGPNFISSYEHATLVPGQDCALLVARLRQAARHRRSTLPARRLRLLARGGLHPARQMLALPARRTPLLDAASCRDWPHWVLDASPACPSGPTADAARALGPGPPGPKFESSLRGAFAECLCNLSRGRLCDFPHGHKGYWFIQTAGWWPSKSRQATGKAAERPLTIAGPEAATVGVFFWQCWVPHFRYNRTHPPHKINNFLLPKPDRLFKNGYTLF